MKGTNMTGRENWRVGIAAMGLIALMALSAQAAIIGPYTADSDTLHLWHLDEPNPGPAAPAPGVSGSWNLNLNTDLTAFNGVATSGATLGNASYPGFGTALNTAANATSNADGGQRAVSSVTGASGAFTFEALIKTSTIGSLQEIMSMESEDGLATRPFQFFISASGKLGFDNIAAPDGLQELSVAIPTTGPDAFVANQWFHVAVTYNGVANTPNNFVLYWTRVDPSNTAANPIFSGTMVDSLPANTAEFQIGNEGRDEGNDLLGEMDEVRISDIARTADEFIFTVPEPTSLGLLAVGGMMLLSRGKKRGAV